MTMTSREIAEIVHCRAGSLEKLSANHFIIHLVHCRTGSLENIAGIDGHNDRVHCRAGSLKVGFQQQYQWAD